MLLLCFAWKFNIFFVFKEKKKFFNLIADEGFCQHFPT